MCLFADKYEMWILANVLISGSAFLSSIPCSDRVGCSALALIDPFYTESIANCFQNIYKHIQNTPGNLNTWLAGHPAGSIFKNREADRLFCFWAWPAGWPATVYLAAPIYFRCSSICLIVDWICVHMLGCIFLIAGCTSIMCCMQRAAGGAPARWILFFFKSSRPTAQSIMLPSLFLVFSGDPRIDVVEVRTYSVQRRFRWQGQGTVMGNIGTMAAPPRSTNPIN